MVGNKGDSRTERIDAGKTKPGRRSERGGERNSQTNKAKNSKKQPRRRKKERGQQEFLLVA